MKDPTRGSLDEQLAALARDVAPPANLWHGIVFGIANKPSRLRPIALAASVACVTLAGAVAWAVLHGQAAPSSPAVAAQRVSFDEPTDVRYETARTSLETTFHERLALLDPKTRAQIEASLAVIQKAHEDIHNALAAAPASPVLEQLLESTWQEEFDLYDHVVRATQPALTRT